MIKVAIVYHSGYGHTEVIAKAVHLGAASEEGISSQLIKISPQGTITDEEWKALEASHAIIFGSPTYMGSVSGPFKTFADSTSKIWAGYGWKDKIAAGFANSGTLSGDKLSTLINIAVLAAQHGMIWVSNAIKPAGNTPNDVNRIGSYLGIMSQSDHASPEVTPPSGDIETAKQFGQRIAVAAKRWFKG